MSQYVTFFLNSQSTVVQYETFEISHPNFSKTYRVVRNKTDNLLATLETSATVNFEYYPVRIEQGEIVDDLDFSMSITFGDLGEVLPAELDRISEASGYTTRPIVKYRTFRSDNLSAPMLGPIVLEVSDISFSEIGCTIQCRNPTFSVNKTGESYTVGKFSTLKSVL